MTDPLDRHANDDLGIQEDDVGAEEHSNYIDEWLEERVGKPAEDITLADLMKVPRRTDLRYEDVRSPLGGKIAPHLRHLSPEEAADLLERGDRFLDETDDGDAGAGEVEATDSTKHRR
jgi:hypothetical protein